MRARRVRLLLVAALTTGAACSPAAAPPGPGSGTPTAAGPPSRTPPAQPTPGPVTLAFGGDVHFEGEVEAQIDDRELPAALAPLRAADLAVVNLETAITERGEPGPKEFTFRGPAEGLRALRDAGVDVVSGANNHGLDYGRTGLLDTLAAADRAGLALVGAGRDEASAYAPYRVTVKGQRIAVLGATQVLDSFARDSWPATRDRPGMASAVQPDRLLQAVREARTSSDTVVVYLHWGVEREQCPPGRAVELAEALVEAGADVLVGTHAHVLLGDGYLGRAYVHYGLGNYVWYNARGAGGRSGVLTLTVLGRDVQRAEWTPALISNGLPRPVDGTARERALAQREQLRGCTGLSDTRR